MGDEQAAPPPPDDAATSKLESARKLLQGLFAEREADQQSDQAEQ